MRPVKPSIPAFLLLCIALIVVFTNVICKPPGKDKDKNNDIDPDPKGGYEVVRPDIGKDTSTGVFRPNEIIVAFKQQPTPDQIKDIKDAIHSQGITVTDVQKCNSCESYVELWKGNGIHTVIHTEGVSGGSGGTGSKGVGEDSLAKYSLNFVVRLPVDSLNFLKPQFNQDRPFIRPAGAYDTIVIAVLDTGIDTVGFVNGQYLWRNNETRNTLDDDKNCYNDDLFGWNFIGNNMSIGDDNASRHGSLVSSYIIQEFQTDSARNFVQIMSLKTHDARGVGDLFTSICAMHYAIEKGADIINASWGFYYYDTRPHPYMDSLITDIMRREGILFMAAAGNKMDDADAYATAIFRARHGRNPTAQELRNLKIHHFYPACLSKAGNNVLTVTTTNNGHVSSTQNFSSAFVDLGVNADLELSTGQMKFQQPMSRTEFISGSSFAVAIATGKIGAHLPRGSYRPNIDKTTVLAQLNSLSTSRSIPVILFSDTRLNAAVRAGQYSRRR